MGWGLGVAGGFSEAEMARKERQKEQLFVEEQNMINTMLPLAIENRKKRQIDRKKYKEQYSVLTSIVSPDVAQDIIRKGDLFTENFITKVGEMENTLGRQVTEKDLIESEAITRQMEYFPTGMKTVDTVKDGVKSSERVRTAPVPIGYREQGATFDQFMREIMGEFKNTNIDANQLRDDLILNFGKIPGHKQAVANSAHRKIAAQMGVSPNTISSLISEDYDYTDVPMSRDEMFRTEARIPFVKGKEYYEVENAKHVHRINEISKGYTYSYDTDGDGKEEQIPIELADKFLTTEIQLLELQNLQGQRNLTQDQQNAEQIMKTTLPNQLEEQLTTMLGGTTTYNHTTGRATVSFEGSSDRRLKSAVLRKAQVIAMASYNKTVGDYKTGSVIDYMTRAGVLDEDDLRVHILSAAHMVGGADVQQYITTGDITKDIKKQWGDGGTNYPPVPNAPLFAETLKLMKVKAPGMPQRVDKHVDTPKWDSAYLAPFGAFKDAYSGTFDRKNRADKGVQFQEDIITELENYLGTAFDNEQREELVKELNFTEILENPKGRLRREEGIEIERDSDGEIKKTKYELIGEKIAGLPSFVAQHSEIFGLVTPEEEAPAAGDDDDDVDKGITITLNDDTSGIWTGKYTTVDGVDTPQGLGVLKLEDGRSVTGRFNDEGKPEGTWYITEAGGTTRIMEFDTAEETKVIEAEEADAEFDTNYNFFNNAEVLHSSVLSTFSGSLSPVSNEDYERLKVNRDRLDAYYTRYKEKTMTQEEFRESIQGVIEDSLSIADKAFKESSGIFEIGKNIHEDYAQSVLDYQNELKTYTN